MTMCYDLWFYFDKYLSMLAVIETQGYGMNDKMYYVKEKGRGLV